MKKVTRFIKFVLPYKWFAALSIVFVVMSSVFAVSSMVMVAPFLNILFQQEMVYEVNEKDASSTAEENALKIKDKLITDLGTKLQVYIQKNGQFSGLILIGIMVILTSLLKNVFLYFSKFFIIPLRTGVVKDIRNALYDKILRLPLSYYSEQRKGDIISRMTSDVQAIEASVLMSIDLVIKEPIVILIFLSTLFLMSFNLTLFVIILLPITGFLIGRIGKSLKKRSKKAQSKLGFLISVIEETIGGLRIVKAFNAEDTVNKSFRNYNNQYARIVSHMFRRQNLASPLSEFMATMVMVIVLWYGGNLVLGGNSGTMSSSLLIAYLVLFSQLIQPAKSLSTAYYNIQKGKASIDRVDAILNADLRIRDDHDAVDINGFDESIHYKNIQFKYENEYVIKGIDLKIEKGKTVALVGASGSGKSTMADLLPRFFDIQEGELLIDGRSIRKIKVKSLRKLIGYVNQEPILFNDTFYNNIKFGIENVTDEQVIEAAKIAHAHEFIMETPNAYQTNIGDRGGKLSGGQRQRISIARAILKNPPILILDEATSALDTESEKLVQDAIEKLMKNRTSIVIAHRLSTIKNADLICVLQDGKIIEEGSHEELLKLNGNYKKLHEIQTG